MVLTMVDTISAACRNIEKLPAALISGGVIQAAVALSLLIYKAPEGIFLHHGKAPFYFYYGILIAVVIFSLMEASAGFWVSRNLVDRHAIGMTIIWISILPLVLVAGLGGSIFLKS